MKINRIENATRNVVFGMLLKVYQLIIPFIMRTALIYFLGVEYLGLNSLFTSILQVLNLVELGVGSAMIFSMYKPIADDDDKKICALMNLYKIYYRIIGIVVLVIGIMFIPFLKNIVSGDVPANINIYILYLINLIATAMSYWLFAYKNSILQAHQRVDMTSKVLLFTESIKYILQIAVLVIFKNYYYFIVIILLMQIVTNIITAIVSDKMYPQFKAKGHLSKKEIKNINQRILDLFTSKVGYVIVNSADTIVISAFLGLRILAIYQNYYYLITAVIGVVSILFGACTAGIGNSLVVESKEKNFNDFKKLTFIIVWIAGTCTCCFLVLFQPFMNIWVGSELMLDFSIVICLCIYYFLYELNQLFNIYKDAAGIWNKDRFRPLVTALTNLGLNLLMIRTMGLYGVILSTIISMIIVSFPWLLKNLFSEVFNIVYVKPFLKSLFYYLIVIIVSCFICFKVCTLIYVSSFCMLIIRLIICILVSNVIYLLAFYRTKEFKESIRLVNTISGDRLGVLSRFL